MGFDASQDQKDRQRETSYSGNPRDGTEGRDFRSRAAEYSLFGRAAEPSPAPSPFQFLGGLQPSQMMSLMPQIAPSLMGNPMNLNDLYSMYGASPSGAMQPFSMPEPMPGPGARPALGSMPFPMSGPQQPVMRTEPWGPRAISPLMFGR